MNIIVDTCVWSESLRKKPIVRPSTIVQELTEIIKEGRVVLLGVIRQEILSGIRYQSQYVQLRERMRAFEDCPVTTRDYEFAAELFNHCRSRGIQGSNADFLISAVSIRLGASIFTTDRDFHLYARHFKIQIHQARPLFT